VLQNCIKFCSTPYKEGEKCKKKKTGERPKARDLGGGGGGGQKINKKNKMGVSLCGLAIYIKKYFKAKKKNENSNISPCKIIIVKNSS
jgi:hypothetical protein